MRVPAGATVIGAAGKYVVPGFIDTNVHLSLYGGVRERYETKVRYHSRQNDIVLEAAQIELKHGVTTVRDSYGMLVPLTHVRDVIARGDAVGSRILAAGNIVGWGGPYSITFSLIPERDLTIVAGTKNGAVVSRLDKDLGTLEIGKLADLLLLDADPLADIHNIRKLNVVMKEGRVIDTSRLPQQRVLSWPTAAAR